MDGTIAGTYSFSLVEISAEGCTGDVGTFDVDVLPEPIVTASTDVSVCGGDVVTLSVTSLPNDPATVYNRYSDMTLTTFVGTGATLDVSPSATTTYYVVADLNVVYPQYQIML